VNFVSDDPVRAEHVRFLVGRQPDYRGACTAEPAGSDYDALVLPSRMLEIAERLASRSLPIPPASSWVPVIAYGASYDMRRAFLAGCFDYLKDPWGPEELVLRLDRLFRVTRKPQTWMGLSLNGCVLSSDRGTEDLSFVEAAILKTLLAHRGEVVPRDALFYTIWGHLPENASRAVDVHISSLRKKILRLCADNDTGTSVITSVRRIGYMIADDAPGIPQ
jgi:DNA-binding response OmpR family regulator